MKQLENYLNSKDVKSIVNLQVFENKSIKVNKCNTKYCRLQYGTNKLLIVFEGIWCEPEEAEDYVNEINCLISIVNTINEMLEEF